MKGTSSWIERVLHGTFQQGSSRTNVCFSSTLNVCLGAPLLNGHAYLALNFSDVAKQGRSGKRTGENPGQIPQNKD